VHDEIVVECPKADAEQAERWVVTAMVDGMESVLNTPDVEGPRVPVEVEAEIGKAWGG
jgi:DNA polymerase I-like protein with 3'-5' exonuclease and polymerase domains